MFGNYLAKRYVRLNPELTVFASVLLDTVTDLPVSPCVVYLLFCLHAFVMREHDEKGQVVRIHSFVTLVLVSD